ncbi:zinc-dependent alcohol dehydrogenase family protein [Acinetobacter rathckeae]|uniref:zinc-dependent alcohol dehydrogenase family protein n=1 Tax=Acinetobacter rathckeae TaxID=2605272 RepID=UPI0018A2616B|nr:NAD(P)-dependent alcohol dehydrogenase [Acinetobacter rathckeae]MBF7688277.1 NAD(P)-dependent alcohol dehydrogenase [Acinetobacter rathckeae]
MKGLVFDASNGTPQILLKEISDPGQPKRGEIRVRIQASSLNFHDFMVARGIMPTENGRVLLSDGAGVVEAVGEGVQAFKMGDQVVSAFFPHWLAGKPVPAVGNFENTPGDGVDGMATEYVVRSESAFTKIPQGWSMPEAATITTSGLTAWRALVTNGQLKAGETVLIQGTGGVSIAALQIAKAMGAFVIVTSSSDEKLAKVRDMGADELINYKTTPAWGDEVLRLTQGRGVDHVVEVGGPLTINESLKAVKVGGHIAQIGVLSGNEANIPIVDLLAKQVRLQGLIVSSVEDQKAYISALEVIQARPVIDKIFNYTALSEAFDYMQSGNHFGKICMTW